MDGKIIQEAEGIVNGSGFVRMTKPQTFASGAKVTIQTNFTPQVLLAVVSYNRRQEWGSSLCFRPESIVYFPGMGQELTVDVWGDNYIELTPTTTDGFFFTVTVLG